MAIIAPRDRLQPYSTSRRLQGAGSIATISGRVKLANETRAWPGANLATGFQRLASMLPMDFCMRWITVLSEILWMMKLLSSPNTSFGRC